MEHVIITFFLEHCQKFIEKKRINYTDIKCFYLKYYLLKCENGK